MQFHEAAQAVAALLSGGFDTAARLHHVEGAGPLAGALVEAWSLREGLNEPWLLSLCMLSPRAGLDLDAMLAQRLDLRSMLSDGSALWRAGMVTRADAVDSDGGFARYRLEVEPWLSLLAHTRRSQVWQEKTLPEILQSVFSAYGSHASWRFADCVDAHLSRSAFNGSGDKRSYTVQYRETDLDFIARLLAEEGLVYRFESDAGAPLGHTLVILADSVDPAACPEDPCSASALGGAGIRYHRAGIIEDQDSIQAIGGVRMLPIAQAVTLAWDYKAKRVVAASAPTIGSLGGANAPRLEAFDWAGAYAFATSAQAARAAELAQQAHEARHKSWLGRSTVRSLTPGTHFTLTESALDVLAALGQAAGRSTDDRRFLLTRVVHAGINNLPKDDSAAIVGTLDEGGVDLLADWVPDEVKAQAAATGYGNHFEAQRASVPWRPALQDGTGQRLNPRPTAPGVLTASVVGPAGQEIHTDALGRVRIRYDFQTQPGHADSPDTSDGSTWVRMLQRHAGAGMGLQFIPRIGQQVLVGFLDDDIDRPCVLGALHDGRGEGGVPATPGGRPGSTDTSVFATSSDHRPGAQGNLSGGRSPAWHGASAADTLPQGGQRNAAALSGWKDQEFSGLGFTQLVFDDSDGQLRTQLAATQHASQLNLGHLIHQADNHRGSFRGLGFELRTDAYGAVRGGAGVIVSSYGEPGQQPAGDLVAATALARQLETLGRVMNRAARLHQTVQLAADIGTSAPGQSFIDRQAAPFAAVRKLVSGMVDAQDQARAQADAAAKNTSAGDTRVPHTTDPVVAFSARAGLAISAEQDLQWAAAETLGTASGRDTQLAVGGHLRLHTGQAIGVLAGAVGPGDEAAGQGLTIIAAKRDIEVQAQSDTMQIAAQGDLRIESENGHIDFAAAKRIVMRVAGGASITIEGGRIVHSCPGTFTVLAGHKSFLAPGNVAYPLKAFPDATTNPLKRSMRFELGALPQSMRNYAGEPFKLYADGALLKQDVADADGAFTWEHREGTQAYRIELATGQVHDVQVRERFDGDTNARLANSGYRGYRHAGAGKADFVHDGDRFREHVRDNDADGGASE